MCNICKKVLYRLENYNIHVQKHSHGYDYDIYQKPFKRQINLPIHQRYTHTQFNDGEDSQFQPKFIVEKESSEINEKFSTNYTSLENRQTFKPPITYAGTKFSEPSTPTFLP